MHTQIENSKRFPHLANCQLLQNIPADLGKDFLNKSVVKTFKHDKVFIEQGQVSSGIYLIAHGKVEISRLNHSGQSAFMYLAEIGGCIGEIEAIAEKEYIASCTAKKGTILLFLPRQHLLGYLQHLEFVKNLSLIFLERMESNNSFRSIDKLDPVDIRLRAYLHFMSRRSPKIEKSQADLADIICCSRQTMNKELGKLRKLGILDIKSGAVVILDHETLAEGIDR
ncbi:MAG: Crp/Fnr family transcriptional regulator [Rhodobacteraceae bacterium]|nr:Crp/Fnr family transcriptional regulator [Paracoccaceae bacterium]